MTSASGTRAQGTTGGSVDVAAIDVHPPTELGLALWAELAQDGDVAAVHANQLVQLFHPGQPPHRTADVIDATPDFVPVVAFPEVRDGGRPGVGHSERDVT